MIARLGQRHGFARLFAAALTVLTTLLAPAVTYAIQVPGGVPTTTLSNTAAYATGVTYTFSPFRVHPTSTSEGCSITFPADTNVSAASAISPAGTVKITGQTVSVTFTTPIDGKTDFNVVIGGITNPGTSGTYNVGAVTVTERDKWGNLTTDSVTAGDYTITPGSSLTMSITTQKIDFGALDPEATPPAATITMTITATNPYTITRQLTGDIAALNIAVTGTATGIKAAGTTTYTDSVTVSPGWNATPEIPLTATVVYSAVIP